MYNALRDMYIRIAMGYKRRDIVTNIVKRFFYCRVPRAENNLYVKLIHLYWSRIQYTKNNYN